MSSPQQVLIVDDEVDFLSNLGEFLESRGFLPVQASDGVAALERFAEHEPPVAVVDIHMPNMSGIEVLRKLKEFDPAPEVIIITGEGSINSAVECMRLGAFHYVTKPVALRELELLVRRAMDKATLAEAFQRQSEQLRRDPRTAFGGIIAVNPAMSELLEKARAVARSDMPVLIEGETGTGKEVLAGYIHEHSPRAPHVMTVVNCAALTDSLMDSELFGHEKGAFTGANDRRLGLIEVAAQSTLFLDEIGDITPQAQVRLLRFLEQGVVRRIGSTRERRVDVRVVAATHRDLRALVREGTFREDLFHRLSAFPLRIPPLRERPEDIAALCEFFLNRKRSVSQVRALSSTAMDMVQRYGWPGNVRELAHTLERAALLAEVQGANTIGPRHLQLEPVGDAEGEMVSLEEAERRHVERVLSHCAGNRARSASVLGISERHLYRLIRQFGLQ